LTLLGTIAQGNSEFLAWATLKQMTRPGSELIYSALPTVGDMRTGAYAPGGIETGIMGIAFAQMARYYEVPSAGYMGLTNAKAVDAQAGFEKGMSPVAGMLAGLDMINMAGLIDALMTFDFGMLVVDNEIAEMIKRMQRGLEYSEDNIALEIVVEAGPAGMFLDKVHTLERMKSCAVLPAVADRNPRRTWEENGSLDAQGRAMLRVREILTGDNPAVFSEDIDVQIRATFEGLVAGDSLPPPGWKPPAPARTRERRNRRRARRVKGANAS
jgi:trimethylamine--corrinoid protein Co-methyltransferase